MKVLILGVAAVQADAIEELNKMGIETFACAGANDGPGSRYANHFYITDFMKKERVIEIIQRENIDCVYSVGSDLAMPVCSEISEILGLNFFVPSKIAKICNNKNMMRDYFGDEFVGNIKYQILDNKHSNIKLEYPFIMKPSDAQGQRGVFLIKNNTEFLESFEISRSYSRAGLVIIEDYIDGQELSVNVYIVNSEVVFLVSSDREVWPQYQGGLIRKHVVPSRIAEDELNIKIKDLVQRVAEKLGVKNGPLYFQIKIKQNQPYIIEVTPRLDGCHMWRLLKYYTSVNLLKLTFEHLLFSNTGEIDNYKERENGLTLEFLCDAPQNKADYSKYSVPEVALFNYTYYNDGDTIRAVNGRFEKIGYFIVRN